MDLQNLLNKRVRIVVAGVNGKTLTYSGFILSHDSNFVTFRDKYDTIQCWNLSQVLSISEEL